MKWMEITVSTSYEAKEAAADILYQQGVNGLVVEDSQPLPQEEDMGQVLPLDEELLEDRLRLIAYLPADDAVLEKIETIRQAVAALADFDLDPGPAQVALSEVKEEDWAREWRKFFKPIPIGKKLLVKPSWEQVEPQGRLVIELDPGMAFGTGYHATTTMCLESLEQAILGGERVIDVGCGSGILSIAAAKLGAGQVIALDNDPMAVRVAQDNVRASGLAHIINVKESDLVGAEARAADIIVANIVAHVIIRLIPALVPLLKPQGLFIASGIIQERIEAVCHSLKENGFTIQEQLQQDDWCTLLCRRQA